MRVPVAELRHIIDPFFDDVWFDVSYLTVEEVEGAVEAGWLLGEPIVMRRIDESPDVLRLRHISRVAYFVVHGWSGPLVLDGLHLCDGHHRLAAAIVRGDEFVEVDVVGPPPSSLLPPTSSPSESEEDQARVRPA